MRKQIDFDHTLIGTEGITVERRDGVGIDFIKVYNREIKICTDSGILYTLSLNGRRDEYDECILDILMFREVKEMSGEEYCRNKYPCNYDSITDAFNAGKQHIKELHNL